MLETYVQLFFNALLVSSFVPTDGETILRYMMYYGIYSKPLMLLVSVAGATAAFALNWLLGRLAYKWVSSSDSFKNYEGRYTKCNNFANKYALSLVLVGFFNQAEAVLTLVAGTLKVRLPMFLTAVVIGKSVYYSFLIFY